MTLSIQASAQAVPAPAGADRPFVAANGTVPVYSYANAVRESVWVRTAVDSDRDGQPDTIAVDIVWPKEAADSGVKVPVIMVASPY